jgi:heme/copper-type cytochrome/quinol oxidase subunit 1
MTGFCASLHVAAPWLVAVAAIGFLVSFLVYSPLGLMSPFRRWAETPPRGKRLQLAFWTLGLLTIAAVGVCQSHHHWIP